MADWKSRVYEKREQIKNSIPPGWVVAQDALPPSSQLDVTAFPQRCRMLSSKELQITESSVVKLLANLANASWSSVEVTTAFYKRAIIAHQLVNCLTEVFVEQALQRAEELDTYLKEHGHVMGPLHGLPISLKDQINIRGIDSTMGYASWIGKKADKNAVLVDVLESLGAVPFVKTNVPQTLMWAETFNNVFGRTVNPYNRALTSGGSSGGEGALVAMRGSPLGVGSDIGGSIRIPAAFCGLYGLRPSAGRVPYAGCVNSMEGQDSVLSVLGPMADSIQGVKAFMQAVIGARSWTLDPLVIPKPWSNDEYNLVNHNNGQNLCFGIMWNDGLVVPQPPICRGLEIVKQALLDAGHKVMDWKPIKHKEISATVDGIWSAADLEDYEAVLKGLKEPLVSMAPASVDADGFHPGVEFAADGISAFELWQIQKERRALRTEYLSHWNATATTTGTGRPVDAIICPAAAYAAPKHGANNSAAYTKVWNGLDYTSCTLPVTQADESIDVNARNLAEEPFLSLNDKTTSENYDAHTSHGAPIAVQLVGRTMEEEAVIRMVEIVEVAIREYVINKGATPA